MTVLGSIQERFSPPPKTKPAEKTKRISSIPRSFVIAPEDASAVVSAIVSAIAAKALSSLTSLFAAGWEWVKRRTITLLSGFCGMGFWLKTCLFEELTVVETLRKVRFSERREVFQRVQPTFTSATNDGEKIAKIIETAAIVMAKSEGIEDLITPFQTSKIWADASDCNQDCKIGDNVSTNQIRIVKDVLFDVSQAKQFGYTEFAAANTYLGANHSVCLAMVEKQVVLVQKKQNPSFSDISGFVLGGKREAELVKIHRSLGKKMFDILNCLKMNEEEQRLRNGLILFNHEKRIRKKFRIH